MRKICLSFPFKGGYFGDTRRIVEIWKRIPCLLDAQAYIFFYGEDRGLLNAKNIEPVKLRTLIFGKRIKFISRVFSHLLVIYHTLHIPNLSMVYEIQSVFNLSGLLISKIRKIPLVYEVNSVLDYEKEKSFLNNIIIKVAKITEKWTVNHADKIIVTTLDLKETFHLAYEISRKKIYIVPNAAKTDLFYLRDKTECREELGIEKDAKVVCFVGGMGGGHGAKNLVPAAPCVIKSIPNTKLLIVGGGPKKGELEQEVRTLNLNDNFIFTGIISDVEVSKCINASDICVILNRSKLKEAVGGGSPIKLYEYMACGKPVVGTKGQSSFCLLQEKKAGILVDVDNIKEICDAILYLLKNNELREEMGKNGRRLVEEKYTWDIVGKQVARICEGVFKKK